MSSSPARFPEKGPFLSKQWSSGSLMRGLSFLNDQKEKEKLEYGDILAVAKARLEKLKNESSAAPGTPAAGGKTHSPVQSHGSPACASADTPQRLATPLDKSPKFDKDVQDPEEQVAARSDLDEHTDDEEEPADETTVDERKKASDEIKKMAALDAKLRRLCCPKPLSGKLEVSPEIHKQWAAGGQQRKVLLQVLVRAKGDKAVFKKEVEHLSKKSRKNTLKVEKGFYTKENMRKVLGWNAKRIKDAVRYCTVKSRVKTHVRRDKYERDLKEYWVDTATTGTFENEHEESLVDRTSTEGIASSFDLGLPAAPDGIEDQGDESEAVENIKTVVDNLLRVQSRLDTLREKLTALNTSESQQCLPKVDAYRSKLEKRHDELADLKSYFDGHMKASDGEEQFDKAKVSQLQTLLRSIEVETSRALMEDTKLKKTILKSTKPPKGDEPGANAPSGSGKRPRAKAPAKKRKAAVAEPSEPAKKPKIKKKKKAAN